MPYREDDRFGSDLYEGDGVLFIHDGRKCRQEIPPFLWGLAIGWLCFVMMATAGFFSGSSGSVLDLLLAFGFGCLLFFGMPLIWLLGFFVIQTLWGIKGRQTLQIDSLQVRHDWWRPWGSECKSWTRDRAITVTTGPGEEILGSCGALILQIGKTRVVMFLATPGEAEWLCEKVNRFLEATPMTSPKLEPESHKTHAVMTRGKLHDADSGLTILKSLEASGRLEIAGKPLRRVEPGVEIHREPLQSNIPIPVRCGRCHALVPHERVLPDLATAQCTACGFVFSLPGLERIPPPRQNRVSCCRSEIGNPPELRITQGGDFSLYPVFTFFATLFAVGLLLGIGWHVWRLDPTNGMHDLFPQSPKENLGEHLIRLFIMTGFFGSFALLPLWAFLERRTLTLNRDTCRMEVRLLFFRWRRTVLRSEVLFAEHKPSWAIRNLCRLCYGRRKTFHLTFTSRRGTDWLTGEINHFL